jgi:hypothetical protein
MVERGVFPPSEVRSYHTFKTYEVGGPKHMKMTVEEQQKRSERARIKAYYSRQGRKKRPKQKQGGFKNMRLINKSSKPV